MKFTPFAPAKFRRRVFGQLWMLALQFVLGMILVFVGEDAAGGWHTVYTVVIWLHILNALGLIEGAVFISLKEKTKLSWWVSGAIIATSVSGTLTMMTHQDVWSFVMALGFLASCWLTVMQYIEADRRVQSSSKR